MNAVATTTVAILRGTSTDDFGDTVESTTAVATGVPASLIEQRRVVTTESDPQPRAVVFFTGRVSATTDVTDGDRLRDERTGEIYLVDSVSRTSSPVMTNDRRLDLRRVT